MSITSKHPRTLRTSRRQWTTSGSTTMRPSRLQGTATRRSRADTSHRQQYVPTLTCIDTVLTNYLGDMLLEASFLDLVTSTGVLAGAVHSRQGRQHGYARDAVDGICSELASRSFRQIGRAHV